MPTVLLVADDAWVRNDVEGSLIDPAVEFVSVTDARTTVAVAREASPDIYVVDAQVGSMGGMAITRALKEAFGAGALERAPIVMLLDRSADTFMAGRAAADGWIVKPFSAQEFRAVVEAALAAVQVG